MTQLPITEPGIYADILDLYGDRIAPELNSGCWLWFGSQCSAGYGNLKRGGEWLYAHRLSYELESGHRPEPGEVVRHVCDTPACVNPDHLLIGTARDNYQDMVERGRRRNIKGEDVNTAKLAEADVLAIRGRAAAGESVRSIQRDYPMTWSALDCAVRGLTWSHLPGAVPEPVREKPRPSGRCGSQVHNAKLTEAKVADIKRRIAAGERGRAVAAAFGVSPATISAINVGRLWSHV